MNADIVQRIVQHIERAARALHPIVIDGTPEQRAFAHDALNALAAARVLIEASA